MTKAARFLAVDNHGTVVASGDTVEEAWSAGDTRIQNHNSYTGGNLRVEVYELVLVRRDAAELTS